MHILLVHKSYIQDVKKERKKRAFCNIMFHHVLYAKKRLFNNNIIIIIKKEKFPPSHCEIFIPIIRPTDKHSSIFYNYYIYNKKRYIEIIIYIIIRVEEDSYIRVYTRIREYNNTVVKKKNQKKKKGNQAQHAHLFLPPLKSRGNKFTSVLCVIIFIFLYSYNI